MNVADLTLNTVQLEAEMIEAGIAVNGLGTTGVDPDTGENVLHTYDETGAPMPLPDAAYAVVMAHKAVPVVTPEERTARALDDAIERLVAAKTVAERNAAQIDGMRLVADAVRAQGTVRP